MLDNTLNQPSKSRTKNCVEINDDWYGRCETGSKTRFKTSLVRSRLCDYNNAYIHVKGTITIPNTAAASAATNNANKKSNI